MKRILSLLALVLVMVAPHAFPATRNLVVEANAGQQKRVALVIGNSAYQNVPRLKNPVNDARSMAAALNKLGFQVIEVTDASQREMNLAIASFGQKLTAGTAALFFYAGHGMQVKGRNYLVPVDAQIGSEAAVSAETVNVDTVLDQLNASAVSIVILDACRNNPFEHSFRSMGGGLAQMDAPKGSFIAYATAPGRVAADGTGDHGLFTQELLRQIDRPGLPLEEVFKRVRANVSRATGDSQIPWDSSSLTGDFYFRAGARNGTQSGATNVDPAAIELSFWESVKDSHDAGDFQAYLDKYPNGQFVTLAQRRMRSALSQSQPAGQESAVGNVPAPGVAPAGLDQRELAKAQGLFRSLALQGSEFNENFRGATPDLSGSDTLFPISKVEFGADSMTISFDKGNVFDKEAFPQTTIRYADLSTAELVQRKVFFGNWIGLKLTAGLVLWHRPHGSQDERMARVNRLQNAARLLSQAGSGGKP